MKGNKGLMILCVACGLIALVLILVSIYRKSGYNMVLAGALLNRQRIGWMRCLSAV